MEDKEIIKALECCGIYGRYICDEDCPHMQNGIKSIGACERDLKLSALHLINGQKAEICELQLKNAELQLKNAKLIKELEITRTYIHDAGLEWGLLSYYNKVYGVDDHCDCFIQEERYVNQKSTIVDICNGTKERDECSCRGHKSRCTFYPQKETDGDKND